MPRGPDLIAVAIFLVGLVFSFFAVPWMMKPLHQAKEDPPPKAQFSISEIFALIVPLMIAATIIFQPFNPQYPGYDSDVPIMAAVTVQGAIYWWLGVRALSHAGVTDSRRRLFHLALINPVAYVGTIFFCAAPIGFLWVGEGLVGTFTVWTGFVAVLPFWLGAWAIIFRLFRFLAGWIVRQRPIEEEG